MRMFLLSFSLASFAVALAVADDGLPTVPDGFTVDVIAREPLVSNPCVMAFDRLGRICVAQGQQWRGPTPETPGDRIDILIDDDGDGEADRAKTFAEGFNSVQGIAWHGKDLWVANARFLRTAPSRPAACDTCADKIPYCEIQAAYSRGHFWGTEVPRVFVLQSFTRPIFRYAS